MTSKIEIIPSRLDIPVEVANDKVPEVIAAMESDKKQQARNDALLKEANTKINSANEIKEKAARDQHIARANQKALSANAKNFASTGRSSYDPTDKLGLHRSTIDGRTFMQRLINAEVNSYNAVNPASDTKVKQLTVEEDTAHTVIALTATTPTSAAVTLPVQATLLQPMNVLSLNVNPIILSTIDNGHIRLLFNTSDNYAAFRSNNGGELVKHGLFAVGKANTVAQAANYALIALARAELFIDPREAITAPKTEADGTVKNEALFRFFSQRSEVPLSNEIFTEFGEILWTGGMGADDGVQGTLPVLFSYPIIPGNEFQLNSLYLQPAPVYVVITSS
jgi:hypothetical protein